MMVIVCTKESCQKIALTTWKIETIGSANKISY